MLPRCPVHQIFSLPVFISELFALFCVPPPPVPHLCPSATQQQHQGPNPKGSPNPGDYPASSPPLGAALFCI